MKLFEITEGRGFAVTFENGVRVSVQFGFFNYCHNHAIAQSQSVPVEQYVERMTHPDPNLSCPTAELAILGPAGQWLTQAWNANCDEVVMGYAAPADVASAMKWAENWIDD